MGILLRKYNAGDRQIDKLQEITGQNTAAGAVYEVIRNYPLKCGLIEQLRNEKRQLKDLLIEAEIYLDAVRESQEAKNRLIEKIKDLNSMT